MGIGIAHQVDEPASWLLPAFILCVLLSGFFSSAESAFISVPRLRVRYLRESGLRGAEQLERVLDRPERFLATVLLGNNLVNIAAATCLGPGERAELHILVPHAEAASLIRDLPRATSRRPRPSEARPLGVAQLRQRSSAAGSTRANRSAHSSCPGPSAIRSWRISSST